MNRTKELIKNSHRDIPSKLASTRYGNFEQSGDVVTVANTTLVNKNNLYLS